MDPSARAPSVESPPGETLASAGLTINLEQAVGQLNVNLFWGSYSNISPPGNVLEMLGKPLHIAQRARRIDKVSEAIAPLLRKKRQRHLARIRKTRYTPPRTRFRTCLWAKMGGARAHKHHMTTQMLLKELTATFMDEVKKRPPSNKTVRRNGWQTVEEETWPRRGFESLGEVRPPGKLYRNVCPTR